MLVAIAIVAVLLALILPGLASARDHSHGVKCMSQIRQLHIGLEAHMIDSRGVIPDTVQTGNPWDIRIVEKLGLTIPSGRTVLECPSAMKAYGSTASAAGLFSQGINIRWVPDGGHNERRRQEEIVRPAMYPWFADAWAWSALNPPLIMDKIGRIPPIEPSDTDWSMGFIHLDSKANVGFADGHVRPVGRDVLEGDADNGGTPYFFLNR